MALSAINARRSLLRLVPIVVVLGSREALMSQARTFEGIKNVVLVTAASSTAPDGRASTTLLKKDGYTVSIVQNPTISLADDVAVTKRTLAAQDGPAILVGHSYGGVVITEAGNDPKVAGLVYIAAFAPDKGESVSALIKNPPPGAPVPPILPPQDGFLFLDRAKFRESFAADVSAGRRRLHGGLAGPVGSRGAQRRGQRAGVEDEAKLVSRVDRRQDDSARRAACHVQARWFDRRRSQGQSRHLRVAAAGRCGPHREGGERRGARKDSGSTTEKTRAIVAGHIRSRSWPDVARRWAQPTSRIGSFSSFRRNDRVHVETSSSRRDASRRTTRSPSATRTARH